MRCSSGAGSCSVVGTGSTQALTALWVADANNIFVVGAAGTVLRCSSTGSCSAINSGTTQPLYAVGGSGANNVYATGLAGRSSRCSASSGQCTPLTSGSTLSALGVRQRHNNVYIGGTASTLLRCAASATTLHTALGWRHGRCQQSSVASMPPMSITLGSGGSLLRCSADSTTCGALTGGTTTPQLFGLGQQQRLGLRRQHRGWPAALWR